MTPTDLAPLNSAHYWLTNAHVPAPLLVGYNAPTTGDFAHVDIEIQAGVIRQILPCGDRPPTDTHPTATPPTNIPTVDLQRGMVWCGFVDMHTHLDKGHIWERAINRGGSFDDALAAVRADSEKNWDAGDVYRRMSFGLKCSYAHGTTAIRTHIDSAGKQAQISFEVLKAAQADWAGRLTLQGVSLVPTDYFLTPDGEALADLVATAGGVLGAVVFMADDIDAQLDRMFELAAERQLNLDFHTDESGNPNDIALRHVAAAAIRHQFSRQVVCGHCCSLAVQSPDEVLKTITLVQQANLGIVSLPMCNLFLQDRNQQTSGTWALASNLASPVAGSPVASPPITTPFSQPSATPRWRGVTLLHELKHAGVRVAIASDNCRDPFFGFGDHDGLEVFTQGVRIAQLDSPYGDWCRVITTTPADLMGLPQIGRIGVGLSADLVLFKARYFSELLSRPQGDRIVLRQGKPIDSTLPDYAELDDLLLR